MIKDADVADDVRDFLYTALDTAVMYKNETYHFDNWNCSQFVNEILWACGVPVAEYKQYGSGIRGGTAHQREYAYGRGLGNVTGLGWAHSSDMSLLQPGDLLYWNTNPGHVAIYIGEGWIIDNASSFNSGVRLLPPDSPLDEWVRPQF